MKVAVIANDAQKQEWMARQPDTTEVEWLSAVTPVAGADCYIDLLFTADEKRIEALTALQPSLIIVNAVAIAQEELPESFIRINGWSTFLERPIVEASATNETIKARTEEIFSVFNKKTEWIQEIAGFISARVISQIINEAYFTLDEKVSSKAEIDTAMKLGTNYPYGPFEWSSKIGLKNIYALLIRLSEENSRYQPSALLTKEALQA